MYRQQFIVLNLVGGLLVLASYVWGTLADGAVANGLWGGVPESIRPLYTVNMLLSAAGYFLFAPYIAFRIDSSRRDFLGGYSYSIFHVFMLLVLIPSAAWLPLTAWKHAHLLLEEPARHLRLELQHRWRIQLFLCRPYQQQAFPSLNPLASSPPLATRLRDNALCSLRSTSQCLHP